MRVGTLDDFQGQEARVVFVSTTLSRPESLPPPPPDAALDGEAGGGAGAGALDADSARRRQEALAVGFWRNPRRFCVAVTRAKALLVVVGSPLVLAREPFWAQLLRHAAARGAYRGAGLREMRRLLRCRGREGGGGGDGGGDKGGQALAPLLPDVIEEWGGGDGGAGALAALSLDHDGAGHSDADSDADDAASGSGDSGSGADGDGAGGELAAAAAQIARLAYLGVGDAARTFYRTLDEYYEACADEWQFRVAL